jgi:hypothetical protein
MFTAEVADQDGTVLGLLRHLEPAGVEAFLPDGQLAGAFASERDAAVALWRRAHGQVRP